MATNTYLLFKVKKKLRINPYRKQYTFKSICSDLFLNFKLYSEFIQNLFRSYSEFIQNWFRIFLEFSQNWFRIYSELIQNWFRIFLEFSQNWFRIDSEFIQNFLRIFSEFFQNVFRFLLHFELRAKRRRYCLHSTLQLTLQLLTKMKSISTTTT